MNVPAIENKGDVGVLFYGNHLNKDKPNFMLHFHSVIEILYFTEGKTRIVCEGEEYIAEKGDLLLIRSFSPHELYAVDDNYSGHLVLQITPYFVLSQSDSNHGTTFLLMLSFANDKTKVLWKKEECEVLGLDRLFSKLEQEKFKSDCFFPFLRNAYSAEIITTLLRDIGISTSKESTTEDMKQRIFDSMIFIQKNFANDITVEQCAKNVSLSPCYFSRNFKAIIGKSFKEYLNSVRIANANQYLRSTDKPITEIAGLCGFNSTSHFIVTYKKYQGDTPLSRRKNVTVK